MRYSVTHEVTPQPSQIDSHSAPADLYCRAQESLFGLYPKSRKTRQYCTDFYVKERSVIMTKDSQLAD